MDKKIVASVIKESFRYLIEQEKCQICTEESDEFGVFVTYINREAGLRISYEPREGGTFVMIFPLREGEIPKYTGNWHDFQDFLTIVRGKPFNEPRIQDFYNPDPAVLVQTFEGYASLVRDHLGDYLAGDFSITPELEEIVKRRKVEFLSKK